MLASLPPRPLRTCCPLSHIQSMMNSSNHERDVEDPLALLMDLMEPNDANVCFLGDEIGEHAAPNEYINPVEALNSLAPCSESPGSKKSTSSHPRSSEIPNQTAAAMKRKHSEVERSRRRSISEGFAVSRLPDEQERLSIADASNPVQSLQVTLHGESADKPLSKSVLLQQACEVIRDLRRKMQASDLLIPRYALAPVSTGLTAEIQMGQMLCPTSMNSDFSPTTSTGSETRLIHTYGAPGRHLDPAGREAGDKDEPPSCPSTGGNSSSNRASGEFECSSSTECSDAGDPTHNPFCRSVDRCSSHSPLHRNAESGERKKVTINHSDCMTSQRSEYTYRKDLAAAPSCSCPSSSVQMGSPPGQPTLTAVPHDPFCKHETPRDRMRRAIISLLIDSSGQEKLWEDALRRRKKC